MSKPLNGRLAELALIADRGHAEVVYGGQGWVAPNRWISNAIVADFKERGLIEQKDSRVTVTEKGIATLKEKSGS